MNRDFPDYICSTKGYKKRKLSDLDMEEKLEIFDDVMIKKEYHENICARHGIGREFIKTLLKNMKNEPAYLKKLEAKRVSKIEYQYLILDSVERVLDRDKSIKSAKDIQ